ncbi:MAG: hypothetical protein ACKPIH_24620 [Microcystis panniformis]
MDNSAHVAFTHEDRQWDGRFNVPTDEYLESVLACIRNESEKGRFRYVLVGGIELGTKPSQNDYQCRHVHVAAIFHNRASKNSILRNWGINKGYGYYLVPRNRNLPYSGWKNHHIKLHSKEDENKLCLFEHGELPADCHQKAVQASEEEKKRKLDDILLEMRGMLDRGEDEQCFTKFPRNYLTYGSRIKAMLTQKKNFFGENNDPHLWIYGFPGTGKTSILQFVYPDAYKKNLYNKFFDLFDPKIHHHMILEDLDHEAVERLSINFIKTLCDKQGFAIDQKYQTPQLARASILVTSNFSINDILPIDMPGVEQNKAALLRRFFHVRIDNLLRLLQLKIIPKWDQKKLQLEGNTDMGKLFITWDYITDVPLCMPLRSPEEYRKIIREHYYS